MKINKKGMTLIEVIIAITLVAIVSVFLFNILSSVNRQNKNNQDESTLLINQALIIKAIQTDFEDYNLVGIEECSDEDAENIIPSSAFKAETINNIRCVNFVYDSALTNEVNGYFIYYEYETVEGSGDYINIVGYVKGDNKVIRKTLAKPPLYDNTSIHIKTKCNSNDVCYLNSSFSLINKTYDYGINLSYSYKKSEFNPVSTGFKKYNLYISSN